MPTDKPKNGGCHAKSYDRRTDILLTSPRPNNALLLTLGGAESNKHKSCHHLHHTYGTTTAERIDTPLYPQNPAPREPGPYNPHAKHVYYSPDV